MEKLEKGPVEDYRDDYPTIEKQDASLKSGEPDNAEITKVTKTKKQCDDPQVPTKCMANK